MTHIWNPAVSLWFLREPCDVLSPLNLVLSLNSCLEEGGQGHLFTDSKGGENTITLIVSHFSPQLIRKSGLICGKVSSGAMASLVQKSTQPDFSPLLSPFLFS